MSISTYVYHSFTPLTTSGQSLERVGARCIFSNYITLSMNDCQHDCGGPGGACFASHGNSKQRECRVLATGPPGLV